MIEKLGFIKSILTIGIFLLLLFPLCPQNCIAQDLLQRIEIPSTLNPVGSGARALGMGGAFIAVADDATAGSWNPGGLIQLETPEISVVGAYFQRTEDNTFGTHPEASGPQDITDSNINYLSAALPFMVLNRNMVISVNHQHLYDFNRQWEFSFPLSTSETGTSVDQDVDVDQEGSLSALGIAYCVQVTSRFSFGITFNFWEDGLYENRWHLKTFQSGAGINDQGNDFIFEHNVTDEYDLKGFNTNLGILWNINSHITLGLVFKSPFTADLSHKKDIEMDLVVPNDPGLNLRQSSSKKTDEKLDMPMSYGLGLAYRFSDKFTISMDIYRTEWDDYILTNSEGDKISPITGEPADEADVEPTHQIRFGAEYLYIQDRLIIPIRGGLFYDPAPADGDPDDFYGVSCGSGFAIGKIVFDIAYQYRFGNDVSEYILKEFDFSQEVREHKLLSSLIYYF